MIVQDLKDLPEWPPNSVVICDVETTSWDDKVMAVQPFLGHRVCGYALATEDGSQSWYLPVRHHCQELDGYENLPLEPVQQYLRKLFAREDITYANHNAKFDGRFMHFDGIHIAGPIEDTIVLLRIVDEQRDRRYGGPGYGLDAALKDYVGGRKLDTVKAYLKSIKSKDFGRCPIRVMGPYAEQDASGCAKLRLKLLAKLPKLSERIWEIEKRTSKMMLKTEIRGVHINRKDLRNDWLSLLPELIHKLEVIQNVAGWEVNVGSSKDLTKFLWHQLGIEPVAWTHNGEPSWTALGIESIVYPDTCPEGFGELLAGASRLSHFLSTYCEGWYNRLDDDDCLHPEFKQHGTITGRLSSSDPNFQNVDDVAEGWITPRPGRILVYFDYSQMEYRIFGHYTKSPMIMEAYAKNIDADFHQFLADMLGVPRQFAKTQNFSFIYGMGKKALLKSLTAVLALALKRGDERMEAKLHQLLVSGTAMKEQAHHLTDSETSVVAEKLYKQYHTMIPEIAAFQKRVAQLCRVRGWIRNFYGRMYRLAARLAYKGVNYIIQGTAGDHAKLKATEIDEQLSAEFDPWLLDLVHDSHLWSVLEEQGYGFFQRVVPIAESSEFRIPMRVDVKVSASSWAQAVAVSRDATRDEFYAAVQASREKERMTWATRELRKYEGTSTKGHGGI